MEGDGGSASTQVSTTASRRTRTNTGCITCRYVYLTLERHPFQVASLINLDLVLTLTTRIRRVKCDETKPSCNRCTSSKRVCDGYLAHNSTHRRSPSHGAGCKARKTLSRRALASVVRQLHAPGPSARLLSPSPYLSDDVACYDFFRFRLTTAASESRHSQTTRGFWNSTLLQVSHAEPAVWHAVAALGALYRKWEVISKDSEIARASQTLPTEYLDDTDWSTSSSRKDGDNLRLIDDLDSHSVRLAEQAGVCYTRALSLAKSVRDASSMLVLSLALAATANLSGKWLDSSVHYQAGQRIMSQMRREIPGKPMTEVQIHAAESLAKLGLQLVSFQEQSTPYPCGEIQEAGMNSSGEPFPRSLVSSHDQRGWGLHRANIELVDIIRRILNEAGLYIPGDLPMQPLTDNHIQIQLAIIRDLEAWQHGTCHVLSNTTDTCTHRTTLDLLSIKLLHTLARLLVAASVMRPDLHTELSWDTHLAYFDRIVALSALILRTEQHQNPLLLSVMSLDEPALNMALWITATRCRQPVVRHRALQLLRGARRLEGVWMSTSAAAAAEKMIAIEEERGIDNTPLMARWAAIESALVAGIEAEDHEPRSWLGQEAKWAMTTASQWDSPGEILVPLERRITQVDVTGEYDPHIGRSRADMMLLFAGRDERGLLRRERVSVYF